MNKPLKFQYADPWLLLSILFACENGKSSLSDVICCGDFINHAIFSFEELQGGFSRLISSGYIFEENDQYYPTDKIAIPYSKFAKKVKSVYKRLDFIRLELKAPGWSEDYNPSKANMGCSYKGINQEILTKAYNVYIKKVKK